MLETATCECCNRSYKKKNSQQKYCSDKCRRVIKREVHVKRYNKSTLNHLPTGNVGAISELEMCAYYLREGYEVFRNVSPNGPADIIIWKPETGELHLLDIKSYVYIGDPKTYIENMEKDKTYSVKIIPYDYNNKEPLRTLSVPGG